MHTLIRSPLSSLCPPCRVQGQAGHDDPHDPDRDGDIEWEASFVYAYW